MNQQSPVLNFLPKEAVKRASNLTSYAAASNYIGQVTSVEYTNMHNLLWAINRTTTISFTLKYVELTTGYLFKKLVIFAYYWYIHPDLTVTGNTRIKAKSPPCIFTMHYLLPLDLYDLLWDYRLLNSVCYYCTWCLSRRTIIKDIGHNYYLRFSGSIKILLSHCPCFNVMYIIHGHFIVHFVKVILVTDSNQLNSGSKLVLWSCVSCG